MFILISLFVGMFVLVMLFPPAVSYGLWQEKDLALDALAAEVDRDSLLDAQVETIATHNAEMNTLIGLFAEQVTRPQLAVRTGAGENRLQPLDENGDPLPVKGQGQYIVGLPLWKGGTAEGWNFWTGEQMTVKDYADSLDLMLKGDIKWVRDHILSTFFYNGAGFTYSDPRAGENYTVYGPANGDSVVYNKSTGAATDTHFYAQAAAIDSSNNPLSDIYTDLVEHPENGERVVAFVATNLVAPIKLLPGFAPVERMIINVVPAAGAEQTDPLFAPDLNLPLSRSMIFRGTHENTHIVEWPAIPSGYMISLAVDADEKALAMREYPQASLRGLINVGETMERFPYQKKRYLRAAGFGARNRVAAHVARIGNGTYAAPTGYGFPQA